MKPAPFEYDRPDSLEEVLELLALHGDSAKLLAGGQSLVPVMNFRLAQPARLIDLGRIEELRGVCRDPEGGWSIGAMTPVRAVERTSQLADEQPLLAEAVPWIAHPQIRNRGTVGGSLAHADPAAELPAVAVASEARLRVVSRRGERWLDAEDFFIALFATALEADEILAEIRFPALGPATGTAFEEVARRHGDYAQAGVAVRVEADPAGRIRSARLVYLSLGDRPISVRAGEALVGEVPSDEIFREVAARALEELEPRTDVHATADFKRHLAKTLTRRVLRRAVSRAGEAA